MAVAKINSATLVGLDSYPVTVEVNVEEKGFPSFAIVGLASKEVEESKERVRSAIKNSKYYFPKHRITVNLAPADLPKKGSAFDLPIALGIIIASSQLSTYPADTSLKLFVGELSLDAKIRPIPGILPLVFYAQKKGFTHVYIPKRNNKEASIVSNIKIYGVRNLSRIIHHLEGRNLIYPEKKVDFGSILNQFQDHEVDMSDVIGQDRAKRALTIAAAGGHNLIFVGPPGSGKTMLARVLPSIMPKLTPEEALEITKIYSISGELGSNKHIISTRPFRSPHHTTSRIGLIGGGSKIMPGEISLAHRGVLFMDEFPELPRHVLEALRQPLEDGVVTISRSSGTLTYPANFMLVAASNPCPCGNFGNPKKVCSCSLYTIEKYKKRISGPILDRIDIHIEVPLVEASKLSLRQKDGKSSKEIREIVQASRDAQKERFKGLNIVCNADMGARDIKKFCNLDSKSEQLLNFSTNKYGFSARTYFKIIKVARTIADLECRKEMLAEDVQEAIGLRVKG